MALAIHAHPMYPLPARATSTVKDPSSMSRAISAILTVIYSGLVEFAGFAAGSRRWIGLIAGCLCPCSPLVLFRLPAAERLRYSAQMARRVHSFGGAERPRCRVDSVTAESLYQSHDSVSRVVDRSRLR